MLCVSVLICCVLYPLALWAVGQTLFPFQANGSIINGSDGKPVGSRLIAQPFTKDDYFQPRPSACSYDASASSSSALRPPTMPCATGWPAPSGPLVTYRGGPKDGQPVAPDMEKWFQQDKYRVNRTWWSSGRTSTTPWLRPGPRRIQNGAYIDDWAKKHPDRWPSSSRTTPAPRSPNLRTWPWCSSRTSPRNIPASSPLW